MNKNTLNTPKKNHKLDLLRLSIDSRENTSERCYSETNEILSPPNPVYVSKAFRKINNSEYLGSPIGVDSYKPYQETYGISLKSSFRKSNSSNFTDSDTSSVDKRSNIDSGPTIKGKSVSFYDTPTIFNEKEYKSRIQEMQEKYDNLDRINKEINQEITFKIIEVETTKADCKEIISKFKREVETRDDTIESLQTDLFKSQRHVEEHSNVIQTLKLKITKLIHESLNTSRKYTESQNINKNIYQKLQIQNELVLGFKEDLRLLRQTIAGELSQEGLYEYIYKYLESKLDKVKYESALDIRQLELKIDERNSKITDLEIELTALSQENSKIQQISFNDRYSILSLNENIKELHNSKCKLKSDFESKLEELKIAHAKEIERNIQIIHDYQTQSEKFLDNIKNHYQLNEQNQQQIKVLSEEISSLQRENQRLVASIAIGNEEKTTLEQEINCLREKKSKHIFKRKAIECEIGKLAEENKNLIENNYNLQGEKEEAMNLFIRSQQVLDNHDFNSMNYQEYTSSKITELVEEIKELKQDVEEKNCIIFDLELKMNQREQSLLIPKTEAKVLYDKIKLLKEETENLTEKYKKNWKKYVAKEHEVYQLQKINSILEETISKLNCESKEMQNNLCRSEENARLLRNSLDNYDQADAAVILTSAGASDGSQIGKEIENPEINRNIKDFYDKEFNLEPRERLDCNIIDKAEEQSIHIDDILQHIEENGAIIIKRIEGLERKIRALGSVENTSEDLTIASSKLFEENHIDKCDRSACNISRSREIESCLEDAREIKEFILNLYKVSATYVENISKTSFTEETNMLERIIQTKFNHCKIQEELSVWNCQNNAIFEILKKYSELIELEVESFHRFSYLNKKIGKMHRVYQNLKESMVSEENHHINGEENRLKFQDCILKEYEDIREWHENLRDSILCISIQGIEKTVKNSNILDIE